MRIRIVSALAFALLFVLALWWFRGWSAPVETAGSATSIAAEPRADSELAQPAVEATPPEREIVAEPAVGESAQPEPEPELARVRGRCVAAESGAPLAEVTVALDAWPLNQAALELHGEPDWREPEPATSGDDGRFEIAFVPSPALQHGLDVQRAGRAPRTARWGAFARGQVEDLGDVELALGYPVEGFVVDRTGAPVEGAYVELDNLPLPLAADMAANASRGGKSGPNGAFRVDAAIPAGTWSLEVRAKGWKLVSPDTVAVVEGRGSAPLNVVVRAMPSISGVVVDESGAGVAQVYVQVEMHRSGRMAASWTRDDGSFTLHAVEDELAPARLVVRHAETFESLGEPAGPFVWGATGVRIELRRARTLDLVVVEAGSGAAVEEFAVACRLERNGWDSSSDGLRQGGRHPGGRLTVEGLRRGVNRITIAPQDPLLAPSAPVTVEVGDAPLGELRIELVRLEERRVRVVDAAGRPIAGSQVELIRLGEEPLDAGSWVHDPRPGRSFTNGDVETMHQLVGEATSNADGVARLPFRADVRLGLRITGPSHPPKVVEDARFPDGDEVLDVAVPTGARVEGRVRVAGYAGIGLALEFQRVDAQARGDEPRVAVGGDGAFRGPSLAAGTYAIHLSLDHRTRSELGGSGWSLRLDPPLATVTLAEGEVAVLELDGSPLDAGEVHGTVLLNGAPSSECRVRLIRESTRFGQFVPDAGGRFVATGLPPGTWGAELVVGDFKTTDGDVIPSDASFALAPGGRVTRDLAFVRRRVVLLLIDADGTTPLASTDVEVSGGRPASFAERRTDAAGRLVLDPAPLGEIRLHADGLFSDPVPLPSHGEATEVRVELRRR